MPKLAPIMLLRFALALFTVGLASLAIAQETTGALPFSMRSGWDRHAVPTIAAEPFDPDATAADDALRDAAEKLPLYARFVTALADPSTDGLWTDLPDGGRVWRLRVSSPGAQAMELFFRDTHFPPGAQLHLYDEAGQQVVGGYAAIHVQPDGSFSTEPIFSDACIIEYHEPAEVRGEGTFRLVDVAHAYRMVSLLKADACEVDVNCSEGGAWQEQRDAVVRIRVVIPTGAGFCTGTLVNNSAMDCKGYVLTAFHCTEESVAANYASYQFRFQYQRPSCNMGSATGQSITGCDRRGGSQDEGGTFGSDYTLLELTAPIPASYTPYWAGWDATGTGSTGGASIHHPDGDVKKISTFSGPALSSSWMGNASGSHWRVTWVATANGWGVTEPGSSGSPLFNNAKRVIGTLTGGLSCCVAGNCGSGTSPNAPDYYGKVSYHWGSLNPNPTEEELRWWLSPVWNITSMNGSANPCASIGIEEHAGELAPRLFPNPTTDRLTLQPPLDAQELERIEVSDLMGRVLVNDRFSGTGPVQIDLSHLPPGTYALTLFADGERYQAVKVGVLR